MLVTLYAIFGLIIIIGVYQLYRVREHRLKKQFDAMNNDNGSSIKKITDSTRSKLRKDFKRVRRNNNK